MSPLTRKYKYVIPAGSMLTTCRDRLQPESGSLEKKLRIPAQHTAGMTTNSVDSDEQTVVLVPKIKLDPIFLSALLPFPDPARFPHHKPEDMVAAVIPYQGPVSLR